MLSSKDTQLQKHPKHHNHPKLKQEVATMDMDPNNKGGLQNESPTTTTTKAPTSSPKNTNPKQYQPPLLLNLHHHHTSTPPPLRITTTTTTLTTPRLSRHKSNKTRLKSPRQAANITIAFRRNNHGE